MTVYCAGVMSAHITHYISVRQVVGGCSCGVEGGYLNRRRCPRPRLPAFSSARWFPIPSSSSPGHPSFLLLLLRLLTVCVVGWGIISLRERVLGWESSSVVSGERGDRRGVPGFLWMPHSSFLCRTSFPTAFRLCIASHECVGRRFIVCVSFSGYLLLITRLCGGVTFPKVWWSRFVVPTYRRREGIPSRLPMRKGRMCFSLSMTCHMWVCALS